MKRQRIINLIFATGILMALFFSLFLVKKPLAVDSLSYIGIIATLIGVIVTILIGFQIINAVEINRKLVDLEKKSKELELAVFKSEEDREAFTSTILMINPESFGEITNYIILLAELRSMRWALKYKEVWDFPFDIIDNLENDAFETYYIQEVDGSLRIYGRKLKALKKQEALDLFMDEVHNIEILIRKEPKFYTIEAKFNRLMQNFHIKMGQLYNIK